MESLSNGSLRLFRVAGITVFLHWSWFLVAVLQVGSGNRYQSQAWFAVEYLSLFGIVLLHEFGHSLACRSVGGVADRIVLWPLGGVAYVRPPARPGAVLWSIAAGPLVNVLLLPVTIGALVCVERYGWADSFPDLHKYLYSLAFINAGLLVFNLLPIYPLDGGQILWALLWFVVGRWRALQWVSLIGMGVGGLVVFLALAFPGLGMLWLGLLAGFVVFRSLAGFRLARHVLHVESLPRNPLARCPGCGNQPPTGPFWVCDHCHARFDTFKTRGTCPECGAWYHETACPDCGQSNHIDRWLAQPSAESPAMVSPLTATPDPSLRNPS